MPIDRFRSIDGDIDFDGGIDADDLTVFANNFGTGIGNPLSSRQRAVAAVPEPATLVLAFLGRFGLIAQVLFGRSRGPAVRRACR